MLRQQCRALDVVGRLGGDEFLVILPMTKPSEAQVFVGRVQASLREHGAEQSRVRGLHAQHGRGRVAPPRHHREQPAGRGRHGAVQGQAGRPQHRRGRGQISRPWPTKRSSCSATLSGWTSSTAPAGAPPPRPISFPISTAFAAGAELQRLDAGATPPPFPRVRRVPRPADRAGGSAARRAASRPAGAIAALNELLARSAGSQQLTRVGGELAAAVRPGPRASGALEAIARSAAADAGRRAVARPPVRAATTCSPLLHRRLPDRQPALVRRRGVRPRRPDRAPPRACRR